MISLTSSGPSTVDCRSSVSKVWLVTFLLVLLQFQAVRGQQERNVTIESLSDAFRYSPSSRFAPGDGGASPDWIDRQKLKVLPVTTLDHTGKGFLRWALEEKRGPRLVVFEVGGVIDLEGYELTIPEGHGEVIVAGQTAPSPGITLIRDALSIRARNVIVQHIRVRPGDDILGEERENGTVNLEEGEGESVDGLQPGGSSELGNQIIDHVTVSWGSDEGLSVTETDGENDPPFRNGDPGPGKRPPITVSTRKL